MRKLKYMIEYYDLKYPYAKYVVVLLLFAIFLFRNNIYIVSMQVLAFLISVIAHELSHGYVALLFGDDTAKREGRLTLNPLKHIDLYGLLLPFILILVHSPIVIGSAKPVPISYYKLRPRKVGVFFVSIAGMFANLVLAFMGILAVKWFGINNEFVYMLVVINIGLIAFNILPIPPLDGSRILRLFLPNDLKRIYDMIEYNPILSLGIILFLMHIGTFDYIYHLIIRLII